MDDTPVDVIGIILAAIIMFIVPLILISERNDDLSQMIASSATADFVNNVVKTGKITTDNYQNLVLSLQSSGNSYDIDLEVKILDENASKVVTDADVKSVGNNAYYSIYTTQIEDRLQRSSANSDLNGKLILKQGDVIAVTVKNSNATFSQALKSFYYRATGSDIHIIVATSSGTVAINGAT